MKRNKKLILLFLVFIVAIISAVSVKKCAPSDEELLGAVDFEIKRGDITAISWRYDGEENSFVRADDGWELEGDPAFPANDIMLDSMEGALIGVMSSKPISGNASDYGINENSDSITVTKKDGEKIKMVFGELNDITGEYYMTVNDSDEIYLLDSMTKDTFKHTRDNLLQREEIPSLSDMAKITVVRGDNQFELIKDGVWKSGDVTVSDEKMSTFAEEIVNFIWSDCVSYNASDEELKEFGLDTPTLELRVELSDGASYHFCFGNVEGENVYVKYRDSKMVYKVDTSLYSAVPMAIDELI